MDFFINVLRGVLGLVVIIGIALLFSNNRRMVNWRTVGAGLLLQFILAVFILKGAAMGEFFGPLGWPKAFFKWISGFFVLVLEFTIEGAKFIFGDLAVTQSNDGTFFAFQILPTIIFFGSLMAILYHLGIMQRVVQGMAWLVRRILGTSGAESLSVTANIFVGQTEAPLVVRPYLEKMTYSELMAVMTGGMATIAGGVMAAYIAILGNAVAQAQGVPLAEAQLLFAEQLLGASLMAAPAALALAKVMIPEIGQPETTGDVRIEVENKTKNVIDAAAYGAGDGLKLALNVGAMLIAFLALIAMLNYFLAQAGGVFGLDLSMEMLLGWTLAPIAWLIGVPWSDAVQFGSLLGTKVVLNEFVAYLELAKVIGAAEGVTPFVSAKTTVMATFALCGFANFSSIAIQLGGIGPLAPSRTSELAQLGLRAVLAATLANMMTATVAGVLAA